MVGLFGNFAQAEDLTRESSRLEQASRLNTEAAALVKQGKHREAIQRMRQALALRTEVFGGKDELTATWTNNIATVLQSTGDLAAATPMFEKAYSIRHEIFGAKHADTIISLHNLAVNLSSRGEFGRAHRLFAEALSLSREIHGDRHLATARTLLSMGGNHQSRDDFAAARPLMDEALAICLATAGDSDLETARAYATLASLLSNMKDFSAAREHYSKAAKIRMDKLGPKHPDSITSMENLALAFVKLGNQREMVPDLRRTVDLRTEVQGAKHPDTFTSLTNLAALHVYLEDYTAARPLLERSLEGQREQLGADHVNTLRTQQNLAALLVIENDLAAAAPLAESGYNASLALVGERHRHTIEALETLGYVEALRGDWNKARKHFDNAQRQRRDFLHQVLPGLSERQQLRYLAVNNSLHSPLSLGLLQRRDPEMATASATWLANAKGLGQESLTERLQHARDSQNESVRGLVSQLQQTRARLATLSMGNTGGASLLTEQRELQAKEETLSAKLSLAGGRSTSTWTDIAEIRRGIPKGSVLIDIARLEIRDFRPRRGIPKRPIRYVAWIVPAAGDGSIAIVDLGSADKIDAAVASVRKEMSIASHKVQQDGEQLGEESLREALEPLADLLLKPLSAAPGVAKAEDLIISPDGNLWLIPWQALPLLDGRYLVERFGIRLVVSGRSLTSVKQVRGGSTAPLIFANPNFDATPNDVLAAAKLTLGDKFVARAESASTSIQLGSRLPKVSALPGTADEAKAAAPAIDRFASARSSTWSGASASEPVFNPSYAAARYFGLFLVRNRA